VKELREKLEEKVSGLGIDPKFKENPAYASALAEIENLIGEMNMFEAAEVVTVSEEEGNISFEWTSTVGDKYSMSISSSDPETFRCIRTEEKKSFVGTNGQTIRQKNVIEEVATMDKSGFITLITNGSMINNMDCGIGKCNNTTWAEKKYYTSDGVMRDREYKGFSQGELLEDFERARIDSMLCIPRQAFDFGPWHDKYETRTLLTREKLDTARVVSEDRSKGIKYNATAPLNQEHGLRDMVLLGGYDTYPQDVVISPLSTDQIEAMIQRESNPKVAEGLRAYAVDRENYFYNSAMDENFVREGISKSQGMPR